MARKRHVTEDGTESDHQHLDDAGQPGQPSQPVDDAQDGQAGPLEAELAELKDRYYRSVAEMENIRRRARMDVEDARKFANEVLISGLLPVLDNFARALEAAEQTRDFDALKSGVELTGRQLSDALSRAGLDRIPAVGQPFDPNVHEAIMQVEPQDGQEPHQVVEELRAGYRLNDRVLRPSLVKVTSA